MAKRKASAAKPQRRPRGEIDRNYFFGDVLIKTGVAVGVALGLIALYTPFTLMDAINDGMYDYLAVMGTFGAHRLGCVPCGPPPAPRSHALGFRLDIRQRALDLAPPKSRVSADEREPVLNAAECTRLGAYLSKLLGSPTVSVVSKSAEEADVLVDGNRVAGCCATKTKASSATRSASPCRASAGRQEERADRRRRALASANALRQDAARRRSRRARAPAQDG